MANLEQLGKFLGPFFHYLKKMKLELTCPSCSIVLRRPMLLPCTHVVCSQCIMAENGHEYKCPVCITTCLSGDLRPIMLMEKMIDIFKSLDDAIASSVQKLFPLFLAGNNYTKEKDKEELASNEFGGQQNNLQSHPPLPGFVTRHMSKDGGGNGEHPTSDGKTCTHNAGKDTEIDLEQPSTPFSLHGFKEPKTNVVQRSGHGSERVYVEELSAKKTDAGTCAETPKALLFQDSCKSNDTKSHISVSSSETDDDIREVKRQRLENKEGKDCNNKPCLDSDHAYAKETVNCAFCHQSYITEFTGSMLHYVNGQPVEPEEVNESKVKHFHEKCFEWAPQAFFDGVIAKNMEGELARASKIKCCECGRNGAALGCYVKSCRRSYHVPCAAEQMGCRWDFVNFNLLCPFHSSCKFQYEVIQFNWAIKAKRTSLVHDKSKTRQARKAKCSSAQSLPGQHTSTPEERCDELWAAEPGVCSQWVLCGSDLSTLEMALLNKFASLSGASVTGKWKPNVSHLIASTNEHGACNRTQKVLMAILNGKWVLTINWVKVCVTARFPVSEEAYEIGFDSYGIADGPKKGRIRALQKAAKIFSGLSFYFTDQFELHYRGFLEEVVLVAGGTILKNVDLVMDASNTKVFSVGSAFIVYNEDPPQTDNSEDLKEVGRKRCDEVGAVEAKTGFKVIGHMRLLDHIAACSSAAELESSSKTRDVTV